MVGYSVGMEHAETIATSPQLVSLDDSFRCCARIARQAASNFYWSFWLLPAAKRRAMCALYAFSRHTDDLGDSNEPADAREQSLARWRTSLSNALSGQCDGSLLPAVIDTVRRYHIPQRYLFEIIDGVTMDLRPEGFESFDALRRYCYHVASAVGLSCIHIWGFTDDAIHEPAVTCGVAFQMTNILRDLKEDAERGRVYLPREDLRRFDYTEDELLHGVRDERYTALMRLEIERTEELYRQAAETRRFLHRDGCRVFDMMFRTYRGLLGEIKRRDGDVFTCRIRLGWTRKLAIAAASCLS
jgi:phytoene synthase